mmetsp:Transcript_131418/g.239033  ORF Transcript_131418/g.239033 Transcript_131418/m.239033 type:complete len:111 (-) Transcript_131418:70-402(-)
MHHGSRITRCFSSSRSCSPPWVSQAASSLLAARPLSLITAMKSRLIGSSFITAGLHIPEAQAVPIPEKVCLHPIEGGRDTLRNWDQRGLQLGSVHPQRSWPSLREPAFFQ